MWNVTVALATDQIEDNGPPRSSGAPSRVTQNCKSILIVIHLASKVIVHRRAVPGNPQSA